MLRVYVTLIMILSGYFLNAQVISDVKSDSKLFSSLSDKFQIGSFNLDVIFDRNTGDTVLIYFRAMPVMAGVITDKIPRRGKDISINIKLLNFSNALLSITKTFDSYNKAIYQGLIIHPNYDDAFLVKSNLGVIELEKRQVDKILLE